MREVISAIDIGTTKICVLTAEVTHDRLGKLALNILGEGQVPSKGIRRGVVVNVPDVTEAVGQAVERCEAASGRELLSAYVGIAGSHIQTFNSRGVSPIDKTMGVTHADMQQALDAARAVALPENQEVIHTIARSWTVDGHGDVQNPIGMTGIRLEVDAHIVTGSTTAVGNLVQCVVSHGIDIDELVLEPLASNESVLRPEERRMGVAVVDLGGGTTDLAVFIDSALCFTQILDLGGNHFSHDLGYALHAPFETAEELKLRYGQVIPERVAEDEKVWAQVFGEKAERNFSRRFISEVLEARAVDMFEIIKNTLDDSSYLDRLPAGLVLTGGSSQLAGLIDLGRETMSMPARLGRPAVDLLPVTGLSPTYESPAYATSVGLLAWGLHEDARSLHRRIEADPVSDVRSDWSRQAARWLRNLLPG